MSTCDTEHEVFTTILSFGIIVGLAGSYVPQHYKIISTRDSEGFSPWFLLLGSTSSAAAMLNMFTLQWKVIKCCQEVSAGRCVESLGGVFQLFLQWSLFSLIFVLFLVFYPSRLKYVKVTTQTDEALVSTPVKTDEWRLSIILAWITLLHFTFSALYTFFLILTSSPGPDGEYPTHQIHLWATFLGVSGAIGAVIQYLPQLIKTYRTKVVGALSIPMMCIQSPGAVVMVLSIALRPGTNWTSWAMFAASGCMQGSLLIMCFFWKARQKRLGLDDFGAPVEEGSRDEERYVDAEDEQMPLLGSR